MLLINGVTPTRFNARDCMRVDFQNGTISFYRRNEGKLIYVPSKNHRSLRDNDVGFQLPLVLNVKNQQDRIAVAQELAGFFAAVSGSEIECHSIESEDKPKLTDGSIFVVRFMDVSFL